jgi:lactate dehydrogenase-like 2-hydroxyacid dehydrogenase
MSGKPVLLSSCRLTEQVESRIAREFSARYNPYERPFTQRELLSAAEGADALIVTPADQLNRFFFEHLARSVKVIATFPVGHDHIDLKAAAQSGIPIANTPDVLTDVTADLAILLLLAASRRANEGQALVRSKEWSWAKSLQILGCQLTGKVLGVFGMGRIGQAVAGRARSFGMKIHYCNRKKLPPELEGDAIFHADPDELLRISPFLTLHAPATEATRHFLQARTIALLPPGAVVVNTARGSLVHDDDLIAALQSGHIAAAGLDVFEGEPNINGGYLSLTNVFLLPHMGSATVETRTVRGMLALDNNSTALVNSPMTTPILAPAKA